MEWSLVIAPQGSTYPKIDGFEGKYFTMYSVDGVVCFLLQIVLSEHYGQPIHNIYVVYKPKKTAEFLLNQVESLFPLGPPTKFRLMIGQENVDKQMTYEKMCNELDDKDMILVCRPVE